MSDCVHSVFHGGKQVVLLVVTLPMLACAQAQDVSERAQAAVAAGRAMPLPDYTKLHRDSGVSGWLTQTQGTQALQALRENGHGVLFAPGRADADACANRHDERCLAVQVVDRNAGTRPSVDPDLTGHLMAGHDDVVAHAAEHVDLGTTGMRPGVCHPATAAVAGAKETHVCDIRQEPTVHEQRATCAKRWQAIIEHAERWACETRWRQPFQTHCAVPVVVPQRTTSTVACWEGELAAEARTCSVIKRDAVREQHRAVCLTPQWKRVTRRCTRKLIVAPVASCTPGVISRASNTSGALAADAVAGVDTLSLAYVCEASERPTVSLATNDAHGAALALGKTAAAQFDFTVAVAGGSVRLTGTNTCSDEDATACQAQALMRVYRGTGSTHVYQGEVTVRLAYRCFAITSQPQRWQEDCTVTGAEG